MNLISRFVEWNRERNLLEPGFNHIKESSFIIEELFESTGQYDSWTAREKASEYAKNIIGEIVADEHDIVDAWADIIIFAVGALAKKGYDPEKVLEEVYREINSRTGKLIHGKFVRDNDAVMYHSDFSKCKL